MSLISYLTKIHFADDVLEAAVQAELGASGCRRPMLITDRRLVASGLVERVLDAVQKQATVTLFDKFPSNPTEFACRTAINIYRENECDLLIAFGAGGAIDLAKATAILASHDGPLASYAAMEGGIARIRNALPPLIAIPTTAGTGSEVSPTAVLLLDDGRKLGFVSPLLIPKVAICDPTLTLDLSPELTASTGMDALTHCIETYVALGYNPPADGIALDGLRRGATNIERAVNKGTDLDARREMMAAAMNGALALQKGLGGVHAMSHALGGHPKLDLDHGELNAVLLPHVLEFNAPAVGHRYDVLNDMIATDRKTSLPGSMSRLAEKLGMPASLSALGVTPDTLQVAAAGAVRDHTNSTNPRRASAADYLDLMRAAM